MKAIKYVISRDSHWGNPVDTALQEAADVSLVDLWYLDAVDVTRGMFYYRLRGPPAVIRRTVDEAACVSAFSLDVDDSGVHSLYLRCSFDDGGMLLQLSAAYPVLVETPIEFTADGDMHVVVAAPESAVRELHQDTSFDDAVTVTKVESYSPDTDDVLASLTARQREVLRRGLEQGYYRVPRHVTQQDLATDFDIAQSTMEEHLRQIERKVFPRLLG